MSIRKALAFFVEKVYYFGAFVVICGLIAQNLGSERAHTITIIGLCFEAAIFFLGMFSFEEKENNEKKEEKDESKNKDENKNKENERFSINGYGRYVENGQPIYAITTPNGRPVLLGNGMGYNRPAAIDPVVVNSFPYPDIDDEINNLRKQVDVLLKQIDVMNERKKEQINRWNASMRNAASVVGGVEKKVEGSKGVEKKVEGSKGVEKKVAEVQGIKILAENGGTGVSPEVIEGMINVAKIGGANVSVDKKIAKNISNDDVDIIKNSGKESEKKK